MKPQFIEVALAGTKTIQIKQIDQYYLDAPFHFHQLCELVWIEKSYGKRVVGDNVGNFEEGDLVLMGPNLPHIWQNDRAFAEEEDNGVKSTVIYFPPDFLLNLTDEQNMIRPITELIQRSQRGILFVGKTKQQVVEMLHLISKEKSIKKIIFFLELIHILSSSQEYEYLASVSYKSRYDEKDTGRINKVYQFLIQNFHRDVSLNEVSALCNMTPNAFCRYFKSRTRKSFTRFLNELRVGHAAKLLQNENNSITDVCYACGYNNLSYFNKTFKTIHDIAPSEYRKNLLNIAATR
ncbi:AraC family transcriptional regulator [Niabella hirudinis]|uniref:AraC family transcriptional regulator n=1 Tax=Niabella hirudinis TaxID=1285929 RepID=UPI003EBDB200